MLTLILSFILGWSLCGVVWALVYDRMTERIALILMGPLVWLIVTILSLIAFFVKLYIKYKYYYVLYYNRETKQMRVVNTRNKEECKKNKDEIRSCNGRIVEKD